jgi:hypothetical protein
VDYLDGQLTLTAATDEAMMQDRAYIGTVPDEQYRQWEYSLRTLINKSALYALPGHPVLQTDAGATADLTIYADSDNLIVNPSAETDASGWTATNLSLVRTASSLTGVVGAAVFRAHTPVASACHMQTTAAIDVNPGEAYVVGAAFAMVGTAAGGTVVSQARRVQVVDFNTGAQLYLSAQGSGAIASSMTRLDGSFIVPESTKQVRVRLWLGSTVGEARWDAVKLTPKAGGAADTGYWDGATPASAQYTYAWTGTPHLSTSKRTNITGTDRALDTFTVYPGESWWEYVEPLVQAAGLRLYCDGLNKWHLVNPETWLVPGYVQLKTGLNLEAAADGITRDTETWGTAVVVAYSWTDAKGIQRTKWDAAGTGSRVQLIERSTPYPGPGAAAAILARMARRGHRIDVTGTSQMGAAPSQVAAVELPDGSMLASAVAALTMRFPDGNMDVVLRDPIETPDSAWTALPPGESWLESPVGESWLEETVAL